MSETSFLQASTSTPPQEIFSPSPSSTLSQSHVDERQTYDLGEIRRKRYRVTAQQLAQLEHFFAIDRSPTVARRREIGLQLGISEKQIQIWFQNRRTKAKNSEEKNKGRVRIPNPQAQPEPELTQAVQTELARLIQEEDTSVFFIPCTNLAIGTWRRVSYENPQDLLAWFCEQKRCLTWFVRSREHSFKMQVPLEFILEMEFRNTNPGQGFLSIILSRPPVFYLRKDGHPDDFPARSGWRTCDDWTENREASRVLQHVLGGAALPLAYIMGYIKTQIPTAVASQPPPYTMNNTPCSSTQDGFANASLEIIDHHDSATLEHRQTTSEWGSMLAMDLEDKSHTSPVDYDNRSIANFIAYSPDLKKYPTIS